MKSNALSLPRSLEPPSSGEEFIKLVQKERNQLPEWTRCHTVVSTTPTANTIDENLSTIPESNFVEKKRIPDHFLPTAVWIENSLKRANKVRERLAIESCSITAKYDSILIPTIQSKKDQYKALFLDNPGNAIQVIGELSQPIVLRFLKYFSEWIDSSFPSLSNDPFSLTPLKEGPESIGIVSHQEYQQLSKSLLEHLQWIYFLLCKCDSLLEADDLYTIRMLCKNLIKNRAIVLDVYLSLSIITDDQEVKELEEGEVKALEEGEVKELEEGEVKELEEGEVKELEEGEVKEVGLDPVFVYFTLSIAIISRGWFGQKDLQDTLRHDSSST
jgi:hypothetical protein